MLLSMTGFGEAHCHHDGLAVAVEVRTINSRYFKLSVRASEGYGALEAQIEGAVRQRVRRGTIQVNLRIERARSPEDYRINSEVLERYRQQIESLGQHWNLAGGVSLESMLALPGVVEEATSVTPDATEDWPVIAQTLDQALQHLATMRTDEGRAMAADLRANCQTIAQCLGRIEQRAPLVVQAYRQRLQERLDVALADHEIQLQPADLIREVSVFADRADISEEIVRLRSHLEQFDTTMDTSESCGRKLEFLSQEMFRETNTIGSKANDVEIAKEVIEIKAAIERIREMIQNVE